MRILDELKSKRRTLVDAIDVFRKHAAFGENDFLKIQVDGLRLPSGNLVGLIQIVFDSESLTYWSSLPSSVQFRARRQGSSELTLFDIFDLDGAIADSDGNVSTAGGARLRTVEVIPAALPYHISDLDQSIVFRTIQLLGVEGKCFRSLREGAEPEFEAMIPDLKFLDCSKLADLELPSLKVLTGDIRSSDWTLKKLSQQKVADALNTFGIRVPHPRPRRASSQRNDIV